MALTQVPSLAPVMPWKMRMKETVDPLDKERLKPRPPPVKDFNYDYSWCEKVAPEEWKTKGKPKPKKAATAPTTPPATGGSGTAGSPGGGGSGHGGGNKSDSPPSSKGSSKGAEGPPRRKKSR